MAECIDSLSDSLASLSAGSGDLDIDERLKELGLDDSALAKLLQIEYEYESIFSWKIKKLTGTTQNLMLNRIDKAREECELVVDQGNVFNLSRFYFQLIICYELYLNKSYKESLIEIENVVKTLETCSFDESNKQYSDAYNHIARATNAYIAVSLNLESEKIIKSVKMINKFNCAEKAAICAIKARVFMEYPPKGNDIALTFSVQARNLYSTELEWMIIWLKAKGRVRRYYDHLNKMPEKDELDAADMLSTTKTNSRHLVKASMIFMETAFNYKLKKNFNQSNKYYKLSSDLILKAIELTNDNIELLHSCLKTCINLPKKFHSKTIIDQIIQKLSHVKNSRVDHVLGKYYLKYEKDYEKAKIYLSRGMAAGDFSSSLQLIKVECLMQPVNEFPLVQTLNMIYSVFPTAQRRLIVLSQILIYYYYCENNPKELMHYLKLYLDQEIDDTFKKTYLITAYPMFKTNEFFKTKQFLNTLSMKVNSIIRHHEWKKEEKEIVKDTYDRFNKMTKVQLYKNQHVENKKEYDNNSNKRYSNKNLFCDGHIGNWRKKQVNISSKNDTDLDKIKNPQYPSDSMNISQHKTFEKTNIAFNKESPAHKNIVSDKSTSRSLFQSHTSMNNLNCIDSKKFEKQYSSEDIHVVSVKNESNFKPADGSGRGGYKQSWQKKQEISKIQKGQGLYDNRRQMNFHHTHRNKNVNCQNENLNHKEKIKTPD